MLLFKNRNRDKVSEIVESNKYTYAILCLWYTVLFLSFSLYIFPSIDAFALEQCKTHMYIYTDTHIYEVEIQL